MRGTILTTLFLLSLSFVFAAPIETFEGEDSFDSEDPNVTFIFNISVENTHTNNSSVVNDVQISFSTNFSTVTGTNGTTSSSKSFSSDSNSLTWAGTGLVANSSKEYFWFSFTTPTYVNTYDFSIIASNSTGVYASETLTLSINDIIAPNVTIESPEEKTYTQEYILVNITIDEPGECTYSLDNGITNLTLNPYKGIHFSANVSFNDGKEQLRAYCNDDAGNNNHTQSIFFVLDYEENINEQGSDEENSTDNETTNNTEEENEPEATTSETDSDAETTGETADSNTEKGTGWITVIFFIIGGILIIYILIKLFTPPQEI